MAEDDPKNPDDMLSRRLSSGAEASSADDAPSSSTHLEDTQEFSTFDRDPDPAPQTSAEAPLTSHDAASAQDADGDRPDPAETAAHTGAGRPSLLSDEEWALLGGAGSDEAQTGATGATATTASAAAGPDDGARARAVTVPDHRRYSVLDIIGTIWITLAFPFIVSALAVRAVASGFFLRFEYTLRPGFPADSYGFSADDRMHYGSYVVDYLNNLATSRYLSDVVLPNGVPVFNPEEISHMADVKALVALLYLVGVIGAIIGLVFALHLSRRTGPGIRLSIRLGAILTLVLVVGLGVLAFLGWEAFFTDFHALFFAEGTWQFYLDDALIRLFPAQFWVDAGIAVAAIVLLASLIPFFLTFLGGRRRRAARRTEA